MTKRWRANLAMAVWAILFVVSTWSSDIPFVAPLSFLVVVFVAWDYGLWPALGWIAVVHLIVPSVLVLLGIGPFFVFAEARLMVAAIMLWTLAAVIGLAYLTDKVHTLTTQLQTSRTDLAQTNDQLQAALNEVKELRGLLPICAWCKQIRDDKGEWKTLETYIEEHSRATFTHGMCPKCWEEQMKTMR